MRKGAELNELKAKGDLAKRVFGVDFKDDLQRD